MKKSGYIKLVLVATAFSACNQQKSGREAPVYLRSDSTATYSRARGMGLGGYYYAFRPYGIYSLGRGYARSGYFSGAIREGSNVGSNGFKGTVVRGGFGSSVFHASS